ncbi:MAG: GGDEF domain-containing protein [Actinomycetes bacterium]
MRLPAAVSARATAGAALVVLAAGAVLAAAVTGTPLPAVPVPGVAAAAARHLRGTWAAVVGTGAAVVAPVAVIGPGAPGPAVAALGVGVLAAGLGWWWRQEVTRLEAELARERQRAVSLAVVDDVTGVANRQGLVLLGEQVLEEVRRRGDSAHALLVEVGALADLTRTVGPHADVEVLAAVADALRAGTRGTDVLARWSPDTFVVVGPGSGSAPGELERRIRLRLVDAPPVPAASWPCRVTVGVGVLEPWDSGTLTDLVGRAAEDLSLRRALRAPSAPEPPSAPV